MTEGIRYNMDWPEFNPPERIALLNLIVFFDKYEYGIDDKRPYFTIHQTGLSTTQRMILEFVQSPTRPVTFHLLDITCGRAVLKVHNAFWEFYFNR